jgi:prepilin-type N-terminal cleavage/methylation domain-containing protein
VLLFVAAVPAVPSSAGFTLVELMMTLVIFALVAVAVTVVLQNSAKSKHKTTMKIESEMAARAALDLMARDIRTAGYGSDRDYAVSPQPAIAYVDSQEIILSQNQYPYPDNSSRSRRAAGVQPGGQSQAVPARGYVVHAADPLPHRCRADPVHARREQRRRGERRRRRRAQGADAAATVNPNDYVLVRQVYGDSTANVANNNGGVTERVALIRKPGAAGVPPLFNVYLRGISTPWNWSSGPVPAVKLKDIQRIELRVTATASRPDSRGQYPQTTIKSEVNAARSVPDFGSATFPVTGYVFNDTDGDHFKDVGELGIEGAAVNAGPLTGYTNALGFYQINAPAGPYLLKHSPAIGYSTAMSPDQFSITVVDAPIAQDFADSARSGGTVVVTAWDDANGNGSVDTGEVPLQGVRINIAPGTPEVQSGITDATGRANLFTTVGSYTVTCVAPDSTVVTNTNPQSGTMVNSGSTSHDFLVFHSLQGRITGSVFVDADRDNVVDNGEKPWTTSGWAPLETAVRRPRATPTRMRMATTRSRYRSTTRHTQPPTRSTCSRLTATSRSAPRRWAGSGCRMPPRCPARTSASRTSPSSR